MHFSEKRFGIVLQMQLHVWSLLLLQTWKIIKAKAVIWAISVFQTRQKCCQMQFFLEQQLLHFLYFSLVALFVFSTTWLSEELDYITSFSRDNLSLAIIWDFFQMLELNFQQNGFWKMISLALQLTTVLKVRTRLLDLR